MGETSKNEAPGVCTVSLADEPTEIESTLTGPTGCRKV
jgi:hypothetical protein